MREQVGVLTYMKNMLSIVKKLILMLYCYSDNLGAGGE